MTSIDVTCVLPKVVAPPRIRPERMSAMPSRRQRFWTGTRPMVTCACQARGSAGVPRALERLAHPSLEIPHLGSARGDADPDGARVLETGKRPETPESHGEARHAVGRLLEGQQHLAQLLVGLVAEEAQGEVQIGRRCPRDGLGKRTQAIDLRRHRLPGLLTESQSDEGARHQPASRRRSMSSAVWDDCHLMATRSPSKRQRRTSMPSGVAQPI